MIIEFDDIRKVRPISENMIDEKRLKPYIEEAEILLVVPKLSAKLYKDIDENKTNYQELLDGGYYNEDSEHFEGLKTAIGYLSYSRFIRYQNLNVTAFGAVQKQGQFSEPADSKTIISAANDAEKIGLEYLAQCIKYLKFTGKIDKEKIIKVGRTRFKAIGR